MRLIRRRDFSSQAGPMALAALAVCLLATGCQTAPFDHVDGAAATFNANRMPTVDRQPAAAEPGSQKETTSSFASQSTAPAAQPSSPSNDALVIENLNLGHREAALNRLEQAEAYYRRVLEIQPENVVANHRLAVIADKKRDFARAEHFYLSALQHDGRNPDLLSDLGYSYLLQGRREDCERCLLAATRLDPSHPKALHNLSLLYAMNGDYDRSFDALRRAVGESEARVKIARLFPSGRPTAAGKESMVASFQPSDSQEGNPPAAVESADATHPTGAPPMPEMRESGLNAAPVASQVGSSEAPVAPAGTPSPSGTPTPPTGRVPDSQINSVFAAIDREDAQEPPAVAAAPASKTATPKSHAASPAGVTASASDAPELEAAPGADPLASMPLWSPGTPPTQHQKSPAAFLLDEAASAPAPQHPHAVATGVVPAGETGQPSINPNNTDALSLFEAELAKDKAAGSSRANSNSGSARDPLIVDRNKSDQLGSGGQGKAADDASWPAEFGAAPPLRIQPRSSTPAPLFEPVDGFGAANDFAPGEKSSAPAWPSTNGNPALPSTDATDAGPVIRPSPSN